MNGEETSSPQSEESKVFFLPYNLKFVFDELFTCGWPDVSWLRDPAISISLLISLMLWMAWLALNLGKVRVPVLFC